MIPLRGYSTGEESWLKPIGFFLPQAGSRIFSICMIDADHFKNLNDSCGISPETGCSVNSRPSSGGLREARNHWALRREEFLVLLPDAGAKEAAETAEKLRAGIEAAQWISMEKRFRSRSASVSRPQVCTLEEETIHSLVSRADRALTGRKTAAGTASASSGRRL